VKAKGCLADVMCRYCLLRSDLYSFKSSVPSSLHEIQIEGTFKDGTYLVTVHDPICTDDGDLSKALHGSFFPIPSTDTFPLSPPPNGLDLPGAVRVHPGTITLNEGRRRAKLKVTNRGDRPIQVMRLQFLSDTRSDLITTLSRRTPSSILTGQ
jgi:urease